MELVPSRVAAEQLGVSQRRARALAAAGGLDAEKIGNRWFVRPASVDRRQSRDRAVGRPMAAANAWALLLLASGEQPSWLDALVVARLRRRLRQRGLRVQLPRLSSRGHVRYLLGSAAAQDELRKNPDFVASGVSAADEYGADVIAPNVVEGYLPAPAADRLAHVFALREVDEMRANIILRVPALWPFDQHKVAPRAVVAADLAESLSARARDAGELLLSTVA